MLKWDKSDYINTNTDTSANTAGNCRSTSNRKSVLLRGIKYFLLIASILISGYLFASQGPLDSLAAKFGFTPEIGTQIDTLNGVPVYHNGIVITQTQGRHYASNGYYYGQKWQCVEFVKRYYHDHYKHKMPNVWGHAKSFYNAELKHGELNQERQLLQYKNGNDEIPKTGDLVVFTYGGYGHVAIVSKVDASKQFVEIVQQNILGKPRVRLPLIAKNGLYTMGQSNKPAGWLRMQP